jgi:cell division protein FtsW (lipid II flippase)
MSALPRPQQQAPARSDYVLVGAAVLLTIIGLVTVWSASFVIGIVRFGDPYAYLVRQLIGACLGGLVALALWRTDYRRLRLLALPIMLLTIVALVAVLVVGEERNGAQRWSSPSCRSPSISQPGSPVREGTSAAGRTASSPSSSSPAASPA